MRTPNIQTTRQVLPQIYAYTTPGVAYHKGWIKIGYTEMQSVSERIKQQSQTIAVTCQKEWSGNAVYEGSAETFTDKAFHAYLERLGYKREPGTEWFEISPEESKSCFRDFRENRGVAQDKPIISYQLRGSQAEAVELAARVFGDQDHPDREVLWNAKPRFGKTLAVYDLCMREEYEKVLVVTNRPAVAVSWYEDYLKFVGQERYCFVSRIDALLHRPDKCMTREEYERAKSSLWGVNGVIEFVSLQDLKGSSHVGGNYDKLEEVTQEVWDLLVIDEAHEGVDTYKTDVAFEQIQRKHTLHLSGTPFKALATDKFHPEAVYSWTYADECEAKANWDPKDGDNPYESMPQLHMYSYRMGDIVLDKAREGILIDGDREAYAFDLYEFFRVERGRFVHQEAVDKWLDALSTQSRYPFSSDELRRELRHTFWLLDRVDSAKKLAERLRDIERHPEFANFEIIVAAGDGKTDEDEEIEDESSLERVRTAIREHPKGTITLSVGQLTTGVTIPEWTGVLILSNIKSPAQYMQAAFRAQTPYLYKDAAGHYQRKTNAYIFDFDPARSLTTYEEMAVGLYPREVSESDEQETRERQIAKLINFFPVIAEDEEGEMQELDAAQVMRIPRQIRSKEVVRSGFMSNFLFANISNIYGCSSGVIDIINQLDPVKAPSMGEVQAATVEELRRETDAEGNAVSDADRLLVVQEGLFGDKIYATDNSVVSDMVAETMETFNKCHKSSGKSKIEQMIDSVSNRLTKSIIDKANWDAVGSQDGYGRPLTKRSISNIKIRIRQVTNKQIGKACHQTAIKKNKIDLNCKKECYGKTTQQMDQLKKEAEEKKRRLDKDLESRVRERTLDIITEGAKIVSDAYEHQRIEDKKSETNELIRDRLRGFSRTIPSFLMGYGDEKTTLQNFHKIASKEVFQEVTGISEEQFRLLRDGGDFINPKTKEKESCPGHFFDEVVFDDAVQEFIQLRRKLANYFDPKVKEDIFDYIPPQKTNQIFTPKAVVKRMVDLLEQESPGCFDDPNKTYADLYMKSGQYITEIVKRLYKSEGLRSAFPDDEERLRHIFRHQVYGLAPTECIYRIALRYILGFDDKIHITEHNLRQGDCVPAAKAGQMSAFLDKVFGKAAQGILPSNAHQTVC